MGGAGLTGTKYPIYSLLTQPEQCPQRGAAGQDGAPLPLSPWQGQNLPLIPALGASTERALLTGHHVQLVQTTANNSAFQSKLASECLSATAA